MLISMLPALVLIARPTPAFQLDPLSSGPVAVERLGSPRKAQESSPRSEPGPRAREPDRLSVLDVSWQLDEDAVVALVELRPGEHIVAVDGVAPRSDPHAGALIVAHLRLAREVLDLTIDGAQGPRRVLILRRHRHGETSPVGRTCCDRASLATPD